MRSLAFVLFTSFLTVGCSCESTVDVGDTPDAGGAGAYDECGNGVDDDGDDAIDEGCFCGPSEMQECFPAGMLGACGPGTQRCAVMGSTEWGRWGGCEDAPAPSEEACDGDVDDDCDGAIDEGCECGDEPPRRCGATDVGVCEYGMQRCVEGAWGECEGATVPGAELCDNGADDDCDGAVDDPNLCACLPSPELCDNGVDDDCDGAVDEPDACASCEPDEEICGDGIDQDCDGADAPCPEEDAGADTPDAGPPISDAGPACMACPAPGHLSDVPLSTTEGVARVQAIAVDLLGNVYAAGDFEGAVDFGGGARSSAGESDLFVAAFDPSGAWRWDVTRGSTGLDRATDVAVDAAGHVVVAGHFAGTVDLGGGDRTHGDRTQFVLRLGPSGGYLWDRTHPVPDNRFLRIRVASLSTGEVRLGTDLSSNIDFGGGVRTPRGSDGVVVALAADGGYLWDRVISSPAGDQLLDLAVDDAGRTVATGLVRGSVDFGGGVRDVSISRGYAVVYGPDGAYRWDQTFGIAGSAGVVGSGEVRAAAFGPAGDVFLAASITGSRPVDFGGGPRVPEPDPNEALIVARYSGADGAYRWDRQYNSTGGIGVTAEAIAVDAFGNPHVSGSYSGRASFGGPGRDDGDSRRIGFRNAFVAGYAPDGSYRWDRTFGVDEGDVGSSVAAAVDGTISALGGQFGGRVDFGGGARDSSPGAAAGFVVALGCECSR